jgi:predicted aldo/keto reductase-like oxidoreductase
MRTDYIDLYFMHSVSSGNELTADKKSWAEKKKAEGKIRLFGFSTHSNMEMPNMTLLMSNVAAAMDETKLSVGEMDLLQQYARETRWAYCTGCAAICEPAVGGHIPIGDVMRYLMYARSYGDRHRGRIDFQKIPLRIRQQMEAMDYGPAEQRCPQEMAIGKLMREALKELG